MTALTLHRPTPVEFNEEGKATAGFETIEIVMPEETGAKVEVRVGYFPKRGEDLDGWRAEAAIEFRAPFSTVQRLNLAGPYAGRSAAGRERWHSVCDAIDDLINHLVDEQDRARGNQRKWLKIVIAGLTAWNKGYEKEFRRELAVIKTKGLVVVDATCEPSEHDSEERRQILKEFRKAWSNFDRSWRDLGEKALRVRDTQAWREEGHLTFEDWITAEKRPTSIIYQAIHAVRMERMALPVAEKLKVVLDRESHFRAIPAKINGEEITPEEVRDVIKQLAKTVEPDADGLKHAKASDVKAAVKAINETQDYTDEQLRQDRLQVKWDEEDRKRQAAAMTEPETPAKRTGPAPVITGEYCEVHAENEPRFQWEGKVEIWAEDLNAFKSEVAAKFLPLFHTHGHDKDFLLAAAKVFHNWSEEVAARQPTRRAK